VAVVEGQGVAAVAGLREAGLIDLYEYGPVFEPVNPHTYIKIKEIDMTEGNLTVLAPLKVEHWKSTHDGQYYWHAIAPENGEKMADGAQGYAHEQDCINGAKRVTHLISVLRDQPE
jgi:uncharacterized protein YegP (UPF0339 family)